MPEISNFEGFDYVTEANGLKKGIIYDGVKLWIAENFRSAKSVIDYENNEQGIIIGNGVINGITLSTGMMQIPLSASFKMKVEVKDEKLKLTFSQIEIVGRASSQIFTTEADQIRARLEKFGDEIVVFLNNRQASSF